MKFTTDVLDTCNMTLASVPSEFTLKKENNYFYADRDDLNIPLPGKPYLAIRIQRVKE